MFYCISNNIIRIIFIKLILLQFIKLTITYIIMGYNQIEHDKKS